MAQQVFHVHVDPPRFDSHYATVVCQWRVDGDHHRHETGVPSKRALQSVVDTQRSCCREQASTEAPTTPIDVDVTVSTGFGEDLSPRDVQGRTTLDTGEPFEWASAQPAFETYVRPLRAQPGQCALDLSVDVEGARKRVFVGARPDGELVATGDTSWLTDLEDGLQTCRLIAALSEARAQYSLAGAKLVGLTGTPLAGCQPFQRRSVMWASPTPTPAR